MKRILFTLLLLPLTICSQVGIGTTTPNASASLDITSTSRGILIPRMLQAERDAITAPAEGLLIYQLDNAEGFYYNKSGVWTPFDGGPDNDWTEHANGTDMFNANTGNVGIGTNSPTTKLHIEDASGYPTGLSQNFETALAPLTSTDWTLQTTNVNGGIQAIKSGAINDNESSSMYYTFTIPVASTVSFYKKVSTEFSDVLRFYIDGTQFGGNWSGVIAYSQESFALSAGTHTLEWRYVKDYSISSNDDAVYIDDIVIASAVSSSVLRIVDGNQGADKVLMSDANGNASWRTLTYDNIVNVPNIVEFQGMEIPICDSNPVGSTGNFNINIRGISTTVSWEILQQQTTVGLVSAGGDLIAPFTPERLQVRYDFTPALPFIPSGMIMTANNSSTFPDTFSLNYAKKSAASITINITRTDTFADQSSNCWRGQFYFDILMT